MNERRLEEIIAMFSDVGAEAELIRAVKELIQAARNGIEDGRDAARYRWIRDTPMSPTLMGLIATQANAAWDSVIDREIALRGTP